MIIPYEFSNYKSYLKAVERERSFFQKGFRSRLAEVLDCQNAYVTQVLNTDANFSLEQALKVSSFLDLGERETRYFLLLVEHARAGTKDLRLYFEKDLNLLRNEHLNIKERILKSNALTSENQKIYYSSWLFAAIHIVVTIPQYRTIPKIASAFGLSEEFTRETILFLLSAGLLEEKRGELAPGPTQIHLDRDSVHINQHHANWRIAALQFLFSGADQGVRYSTVSSLSVDDAEKLKVKLVQVIAEYVQTVEPSKEQTLFNFNLDFYPLLK